MLQIKYVDLFIARNFLLPLSGQEAILSGRGPARGRKTQRVHRAGEARKVLREPGTSFRSTRCASGDLDHLGQVNLLQVLLSSCEKMKCLDHMNSKASLSFKYSSVIM